MRLPRDISGRELVKLLARLGYAELRRESSHIRVETQLGGRHPMTVPDKNPLRPGMLRKILRDVEAHHKLKHDELLGLLFG